MKNVLYACLIAILLPMATCNAITCVACVAALGSHEPSKPTHPQQAQDRGSLHID